MDVGDLNCWIIAESLIEEPIETDKRANGLWPDRMRRNASRAMMWMLVE
jgi:hypothetical protein